MAERIWDSEPGLKAEADKERQRYDDSFDEEGWVPPQIEPPWPVLDAAALHGLAGEVVGAIAPHSESDPAALLAQFLVMAGNAAGRNAYHQVEGDQHHLNLFTLVIGKTAKARKGTSLGRIRQVLEPADSDWLHQRVLSGLSSGEGLIYQVRDEIKERVKTGKGEDSKYVETVKDPGVDDKRLLIIEAEFARTMAAARRDGNTLSAIVRDAWDRGNLGTLTKNSPTKATGAHISIIGHITIDELRRTLDSTALTNGFANRFLLVCAQRTQLLPFGGRLDPKVVLALAACARQVFDAVGGQQRRIDFDEAAAALWEESYPELSKDEPGLYGAITARSEAQTIRLATIYAVLDRSAVIRSSHLRAALALWRYCADSARYIFGDTIGDPLADELLRLIRSRAPAGVSRSEMSEHLGRNQSSASIGRALADLLKFGKAKPVRKGGNGAGRPVELWVAEWQKL
jgi:hypothetical protein